MDSPTRGKHHNGQLLVYSLFSICAAVLHSKCSCIFWVILVFIHVYGVTLHVFGNVISNLVAAVLVLSPHRCRLALAAKASRATA